MRVRAGRVRRCGGLLVAAGLYASTLFVVQLVPLGAASAATDTYQSTSVNGISFGKVDANDGHTYLTRECTSYVAWRFWHERGVDAPKSWGWAGNWGKNAGSRLNKTPAVGSIAWWSTGHVGYVTGVNGTTITTAEYNWLIPGTKKSYDHAYHERTIPASSTSYPTGFIHWNDGAGQSAPPGSNPSGNVDAARITSGGALHVDGWAFDPDASSGTIDVALFIDGSKAAQARAGNSRPDVGPHGFAFDVSANPEVAHSIQVRALNAGGGADVWLAGSKTVDPVIAKPGRPELTSWSPGPQGISVGWSVPSNGGTPITNYIVKVYDGDTVSKAVSVPASTTETTVNGLVDGTVYTASVAAENSVGVGPESDRTDELIPATPPGAPSNLKGVEVSPGILSFTWSAPAFSGDTPITQYLLYAYSSGVRAFSYPFMGSATAGTAGVTWMPIDPGTYTFSIIAINERVGGPESVQTGEIAVRPLTWAPKITSVEAGNGRATLTWEPPSADVGTITGYRITPYINGQMSSSKVYAPSILTQTVTGLVNGSSHTFTVEAIASKYSGLVSEMSQPVVPNGETLPPTNPLNPSAYMSNYGEATVSWDTPADPGSSEIYAYGVTPVYIENGDWHLLDERYFWADSTTQVIDHLPRGERMGFIVTAVNLQAEGGGDPTNEISITDPSDPPGTPVATANSTGIKVVWSPPLDNGGNVIGGYRVLSYRNGQQISESDVSSGDLPFVLASPSPGSYTFRVSALNANGRSEYSSLSSPVQAATVPAAPLVPNVSPGNAKVHVAWSSPTNPGGTPVSGFRLTVRQGAAIAKTVDVGLVTSVDVLGLENGKGYTVTVSARNSIGLGGESPMSIVITPASVPTAPTGVRVSGMDGGLTTDWSAPSSSGGTPVSGYKVDVVGPGRNSTVVVAADARSAAVTGLTDGVAYHVSVTALNGMGDGPPAASPSPSVAPFPTLAAFVDQTLSDTLGYVDVAAAEAQGVGAVSGSTSPAAWIASLRRSTDAVSNVDPVARLYSAYFLRSADPSGYSYWVGAKRSGRSLGTMSNSFAQSGEFKRRYGDLNNRAFVLLIYTNVLGRPADEAGVSYWTSQLDRKKKTRGQVMVGFSESGEYVRHSQPSVDLNTLWIQLLGASPGVADLDKWLPILTNGGDLSVVVSAVLSDPRYRARFGHG